MLEHVYKKKLKTFIKFITTTI